MRGSRGERPIPQNTETPGKERERVGREEGAWRCRGSSPFATASELKKLKPRDPQFPGRQKKAAKQCKNRSHNLSTRSHRSDKK